jgi:GNAT superfamily N-acetyltransferase
VSVLRFERSDPEEPPASELLAAMRVELNELYETFDRLDKPPVDPAQLRPPSGAYVVGFDGEQAVAGGGVRHLSDGVAEIKRMYVRPAARSRGLAGVLLAELEDTARTLGYDVVRLDTGPKQRHALNLYRRAGYVEVPRYNENPFACFWGEKPLR